MSTAIRRSLPSALAGVLLLGPALLFFVSCGGDRFMYDGTWAGNRNLSRPDIDKYLANTLGSVTLRIHDNTFDLSEASVPIGGNVSFKGDHIELNPTTYISHPIAPSQKAGHPMITVTPQKDGSLLLDNPVAIDGKPVRLVRKPAPGSQ